jgi:hypothetical protein
MSAFCSSNCGFVGPSIEAPRCSPVVVLRSAAGTEGSLSGSHSSLFGSVLAKGTVAVASTPDNVAEGMLDSEAACSMVLVEGVPVLVLLESKTDKGEPLTAALAA